MPLFFVRVLCMFILCACIECCSKESNDNFGGHQMLFYWPWLYFKWKCFSGALLLVWILYSVAFQVESNLLLFSSNYHQSWTLSDSLSVSSSSKKSTPFLTPRTPTPGSTQSAFLVSLSTPRVGCVSPSPYVRDFKKQREILTRKLFTIYNQTVFDNKVNIFFFFTNQHVHESYKSLKI